MITFYFRFDTRLDMFNGRFFAFLFAFRRQFLYRMYCPPLLLFGERTRRFRRIATFFINHDYNGSNSIRTTDFVGLVMFSFQRSGLFFRTRNVITTTIRANNASTIRIASTKRYRIRRFIRRFVRPFTTRNGFTTRIRTFASFRDYSKFLDFHSSQFLAKGSNRVVSDDIRNFKINGDFTGNRISGGFNGLQGLRCIFVVMFFLRTFCSFKGMFIFWSKRSRKPPFLLSDFATLCNYASFNTVNLLSRFSANQFTTFEVCRRCIKGISYYFLDSGTTLEVILAQFHITLGRIGTFGCSAIFFQVHYSSLTFFTFFFADSSSSHVTYFGIRFAR